MEEGRELEDAAWSSAYGVATSQQAALLDADPIGWRVSLERLVAGIDEQISEGQSDSDSLAVAALTAEFPLKVLLVIVSCALPVWKALLKMPPPVKAAELALIALLVIAKVEPRL